MIRVEIPVAVHGVLEPPGFALRIKLDEPEVVNIPGLTVNDVAE